jgi:hypothetical protein
MRWALPSSTWATSQVDEVTTQDNFEYVTAIDASTYVQQVVEAS